MSRSAKCVEISLIDMLNSSVIADPNEDFNRIRDCENREQLLQTIPHLDAMERPRYASNVRHM